MIHVKGGSGGGSAAARKLFGDGSDGTAIISADTTWSAEPEDTGMIVRNFQSLTIAEGVTVAAANRNAGMILRVQGDCTIAGTLANRMACKTLLDSDGVDFSVYPPSMLSSTAGAGGNGGSSGGNGGTGMPGRFYGGGYGAGGGGGGCGGLAGGAGGSAASITTATDIFLGGSGSYRAGGAGAYGGGGGGAGDGDSSPYLYYGGNGGSGPGGSGSTTAKSHTNYSLPGGGGGAGNLGGGVIILYVGGKLVLSGEIACDGSNGGSGARGTYDADRNGGYGSYGSSGASGGGGGGGRIYIVHQGDIENTGTLSVNGGTGAYAGSIGTTSILTYEEYKQQEVS